jgi:hypothetical protein
MNTSHQYGNFDVYDVTLTVSTDAGCASDTTKQVYILDYREALRVDPYAINFEGGQETWVAVADGITANNSWIFGLPGGSKVTTAASGTQAWWTGGNSASYYNNEKSFVIGPCLNLSDLKRPMISLNYWVDAQTGFDGTVVQYSTNGGDTWQTVGDAEGGGIDWYNYRNLHTGPRSCLMQTGHPALKFSKDVRRAKSAWAAIRTRSADESVNPFADHR